MTEDDRRTPLVDRLRDGEELTATEAAVVFGTTRQSIDRWLNRGVLVGGVRHSIRYRSTSAGRMINPADLLAVLAEVERERTATDADPDSGDDTSDR